MEDKSQPNIFHKIMEQGNNLLEAGVIEGVLQLKLTITDTVDVQNIYIGEIRSFEEYGKLKEGFDSFEKVLKFIGDPKNIKICLDSMFTTLVSNFRKKIYVAKVMLEKLEQGVSKPVSLDEIIDKCIQKGKLGNDQIKRNFEILAQQIMQLKQQQRKQTFESLKEENLGKIDQRNHEMEKKHENIQQKQSKQIQLLRKEIESLKINNETQLTYMKELQKVFEQKHCCFESSFKMEMDSLRQEFKNLSQVFIKKIQQVRQQSKNNSIQNIDDMSDRYVNQQSNEPNVGEQGQLQSVIARCNQQFELKIRQTKTFIRVLAEEILTEKFDHQNTINVFRKEIEDQTSKSKLICQKQMNFLKKQILATIKVNYEKITKIIKTMKQQNLKQFQLQYQKIQIFLQKMVYLNVYVQNEKQQKQKQKFNKNIKFYQQQKNFKQFTFDGKTLTKINDSQFGKLFVFFEQVPFEKQLKINIKIIKSKSKFIAIGICDYKQYKQNNWTINNYIHYWAHNGKIYPSKIKEGNGVEVGETVDMIIDRNNKTIKWMVNGVQRASITNEILGDQERQLVPFVGMRDKQDTILFLTQ